MVFGGEQVVVNLHVISPFKLGSHSRTLLAFAFGCSVEAFEAEVGSFCHHYPWCLGELSGETSLFGRECKRGSRCGCCFRGKSKETALPSEKKGKVAETGVMGLGVSLLLSVRNAMFRVMAV